MWFKRRKVKKEEEKKEEEEEGKTKEKDLAPQTEYVSTDTELGRWYNKQLNSNYSERLYSDALDYEMIRQVIGRIDINATIQTELGKRIEKLEFISNEIGGYLDALLEANFREPSSINTAEDYNAKIGDFIFVDATDGPVTVTLPQIGYDDNGATIVVKKMDETQNVVTVTNIEGQGIDVIYRQFVSLAMTARGGLWNLRYER